MEARELRVGVFNEYFIGEEGLEWVLNIVDDQDIKWCANNELDYNKQHRPIIISDEWLIRFGVIIFEDYNEYGERITKIKTNFFTVSFSYIEIKYVHQLQNLYFALTGEELKSSAQPLTQNTNEMTK